MSFGAVKELVVQTFRDWTEDKAARLAAALAYYTIFSLPALLLIALAIAGRFFDQELVRQQVMAQARLAMGTAGSQAIESILENAATARGGGIAVAVAVVTLFLSASGVFGQLQGAMNTIWEVEPKPNQGFLATVKKRLFSFTLVLGVGFLLLVSLVLDAVLSIAGDFLARYLPGSPLLMQVLNYLLSTAITFGLIAAIFKVIPDVKIRWRDVWVGALVTTVLFVITRLLISLYLGNNATASAYGAAGSLVLLLLWVFTSAQILFLGAEFTQVHARMRGVPIEPDEDAIALTERTRVQQGMPSRELQEQLAGEIRPRPDQPGPAFPAAALAAEPWRLRAPEPRQGALSRLRRRAVIVGSGLAALAYGLRGAFGRRSSD